MGNVLQDKRILFQYHRNKDGSVLLPKIFLKTKTLKNIGLIDPVFELMITTNFNEPNTCSFTVFQYNNGFETPLFHRIINLSVIEIEGFGLFQIETAVTDDSAACKKITGTSLQEAELSQLDCTLEINTEADIARTDYDKEYPTVFYRPVGDAVTPKEREKLAQSSLLHRILTYAPLYSIGHVDDSLWGINREFSCSDSYVLDFLQDVAEEAGCIFIFDPFRRVVNAYDLEDHCLTCGDRHIIDGVCQTCKEEGVIEPGYGLNTSLYVDTSTIAETIEDNVDVGGVKNCFKLVAGDDELTNRVGQRLIGNANYIWMFSDDQIEEFSDELKQKWLEYSSFVNQYQEEFEACWDEYNKKTDDILYWQSGKMPVVESSPDQSKTTYYTRRCKEIFDVIVQKIPYYVIGTKNAALSSISNNILKFANFLCPPGYKAAYQTTNDGKKKVSSTSKKVDNIDVIDSFTGYFYIYLKDCQDENQKDNYFYESGAWTIPVIPGYNKMAADQTFSREYYLYLRQMLDFKLANAEASLEPKYDTDYTDGKNHTEDADYYKNYFREYSINRLDSFKNAYDLCVVILGELDSNLSTNEVQRSYHYIINEDGTISEQTMYDKLTEKYQKFSEYIADIIAEYTSHVTADEERREVLSRQIQKINETCNIKKYLDNEELYHELLSFKREQTYQNSNFTSNVTDESVLMQNIEEFILRAKEEIAKACQFQHSVSISMANLLTLTDYENVFDVFALGNYMRTSIHGEMVKLRIISIPFHFDNPEKCEVTFADTLVGNPSLKRMQNNYKKMSSLATSFDYVQKQSTANDQKITSFSQMLSDGLEATKTMVMNADDISTVMDSHGILSRQLDLDTGEYTPEQLRVTNGTIAFTEDGWNSIRSAFGKFWWKDAYRYGIIGDAIVGRILAGENLTITNGDDSSATVKIDQDGIEIKNGFLYLEDKRAETAGDYTGIHVEINPNGENFDGHNEHYVFHVAKGNDIVMGVTNNGDGYFKGKICATEGDFGGKLSSVNGTFEDLQIIDEDGSPLLELADYGISTTGSLTAKYITAEYMTANTSLACKGNTILEGDAKIGLAGKYHEIELGNTHVRGIFDCKDIVANGKVTLCNTTTIGIDGSIDDPIYNDVTLSRTTVEKTLHVMEDITGERSLTVQEDAEIRGALTVAGSITSDSYIIANSIGTTGNISVGGTIGANGDLVIHGNGSVEGSLRIDKYVSTPAVNNLSIPWNYTNVTELRNTTTGYGMQICNWHDGSLGAICPGSAGNPETLGMGVDGYWWSDVYCRNTFSSTSDETEKKEIRDVDADIAVQIVKNAAPISFLWKKNESGRTHYGFGAQSLEKVVNDLGISTDDFAAIVKTPKVKTEKGTERNNQTAIQFTKTGEYTYGIRQNELIPFLWRTVQVLMDNAEKDRERIERLENRLICLERKEEQ